MARLDDLLLKAVARQDVPFVVAATATAAGTVWTGAAGEAAPGVAAAPDTVFRLFSMTKAVGALAAMLLIDRGRLALDAPVADILPAFDELELLAGWDGETPRLRKPGARATIRQLMTHTSGLVYEMWDGDLLRFRRTTGLPSVTSGLRAGLRYPLVFEPGARWGYGIGIDWLGEVVAAVDGRGIDRFCAEEIFRPLGMTATVFALDPAQLPRLAAVYARGSEGGFRRVEAAPPAEPEFYGMGHALYGTAPDYLRLLRLFLGRGVLDGTRLVSCEAVDTMLADHIAPLRVGAMASVSPSATADVEFFPGTPKSHSLGFLRVEADVPDMRSAGAQGWAGILNTHFWFDPARDVAGVFMTQMRPFADQRVMAAYAEFERAVYAQ